MGGGTPKNTTQTTTAEPPAYLRPYLEQGAGAASANYAAGPNQYYPGETVVPMSGQTQQALNLTEQRALNGSPVTDAAKTYAAKTLQQPITSSFGGATNPYASATNNYGSVNNPYLDATFDAAASRTRTALDSQFAGSGRNLAAQMPARSDQLNDLATQIYGGAYENERNRGLSMDQQILGIGAQGYENAQGRALSDITNQRGTNLGLTGLSPGLANQDYTDLGQLGQVGAQYEDLTGRQMEDAAARWDFAQNADDQSLDNFLQRIGMINGGAGGTTSATTPIYRNRTAGAVGGGLSGAATGATIGSAVPGIGTAVGAGVGGLIGLLGGYL